MAQTNPRSLDEILADVRALRAEINARGREDTERFIEIAESANAELDAAEKALAETGADLDATESETPPPGGEQIAVELANLRQEADL